MIYEWDEAKSQTNIRKHGVSFEEAQTVFEDPQLLIHEDIASVGEQRFVAIGVSQHNRQLFVVFCERGRQSEEVTRIISARKLTPRERRRLAQLRLRELTGAKR